MSAAADNIFISLHKVSNIGTLLRWQ